MAEFSAKKFLLQGRVQGVGCRSQVLDLALGIGHLSGFVRNMADLSVEVCVKGPDWRVRDFEKALRENMLHPVRIDHFWSFDLEDSVALPPGFVIRR